MWKDFFYYTRSERRGIVMLILLILILLVLRFSMPFWAVNSKLSFSDEEFVVRVQELNEELKSLNADQSKDSFFVFNPNIVSAEELKLLGFSNYQAKSLIGYRNKIGLFNSKDDLLRVYGIDSVFFVKYVNYIKLPPKDVRSQSLSKDKIKEVWINFNRLDTLFYFDYISSSLYKEKIAELLATRYVNKKLTSSVVRRMSDDRLFLWLKENSVKKQSSYRYTRKSIEINSADTTQFKQLIGIGSVLSKRIVKYRNLLGGFYTIEQIKEVYGVSQEVYEENKEVLVVDSCVVRKMQLEKVTVKQLEKHPYLNRTQAKELFNLARKKLHVSTGDLQRLVSISNHDLEKLRHYISLPN